MFDVITVGSATIDAFATTDKKFATKKNYEFPVGSKILIQELRFLTGGGGTNTAVALSRLGLRTAYLGKIGKGSNSELILNELKKEKIDTSLVCRENSRTGYSIILDAKGHDRTILTYKGSINDLRYREIDKSKLKTKWFYFSSMMEESYKTLEKLADYAEKNSIKVAFNPSTYLAQQGLKKLKNLLQKIDILILNKEEARLIIDEKNIQQLLKKLHYHGPEIVVITDGEMGAHAYFGEKYYYIKAHKIKVIETTGAGDAFASSFLAGIIIKNDIEFALKLGLTNAESVIKLFGAKNKLLRYREALKIIKNSKFNLTSKKV